MVWQEYTFKAIPTHNVCCHSFASACLLTPLAPHRSLYFVRAHAPEVRENEQRAYQGCHCCIDLPATTANSRRLVIS